jgi:hypothetical protein
MKAYIYHSAAHSLVGLCSSSSRNSVNYYVRTGSPIKAIEIKAVILLVRLSISMETGLVLGVRGVPRHSLYDIYCSAYYN